MKIKTLATALLASLFFVGGCLPPVDYKAEDQFQNDLAAEHNDCVITARKACEGASDVNACVEQNAASCVGKTASTQDPYRQSILPSGVSDSYDNPAEALGVDPDINAEWDPGINPDR